MKKLFLLALGVLLGINAWSYDNVAATVTWADGTDKATVTSDASDGIKETKRKVGTALTEGSRNNLAANNGVQMATFKPASNKPGTDASAMVEYSVKMKKGVTFTLTEISYEAIKQGTDNASYHWTYAVDDVAGDTVEVTKDDLLRDNNTSGTPALMHTHTITAAAGQTVCVRFYVSGFDATKMLCLSNIQLKGTVNGEEEVRAFTDFKIEFRDNPYTVVLPENGELPTGVTVEGTTYNGGQHGVQGGTVTVPVDGPVKFTIGACTYSKTLINVKKDGVDFATIDNNAACGEQKPNYNQFVTWTYNVEEAATLTFEFGSQTYVPYFFAEACDFVPEVEVRYFDTDGKTLIGNDILEGGSALTYKYSAADVTVAEGQAFRGWFDGTTLTALKVAEGTPLTEDLNLYAKATDIEEAKLGAIFNYDFRPKSFYPEDHEVLTFNGGKYNDAQHGWAFKSGESIGVKVAGNALLIVGVCTYSATGSTDVKDADGNTVGTLEVVNKETGDGSQQTIQYAGPATTLTLHFTATNYIHGIKVYNISELPEKNESGYYEITPGDAAAFILTLEAAQDGDKIFLPNGTYDLGDAVLTQISKNNISIIGQSMEGTIIKNAPDFHKEGIGTTATIFIPQGVSNTYFQDLTLQNAMDYYGAIAAGLEGGRAVVLQDQGTQTICKNVRLLSYQDTYYSNLQGAVKYFEDCEIHGTVDFICGDGSVYFKNNLLYCEKRNLNGSGSDALTASNAIDSDRGYVFEGCTIKSECPVVSLGRAWNNQPEVEFLNTTLDYSAGEFALADKDGKIQRWTKELMSAGAWPTFGEYNTRDTEGNLLTPSSNVVTFIDKKSGDATKEMETVLSAEQAAVYTMANTLGDWAETAENDAKQVELTYKDGQYNETEATVFLVEKDGKATIVTELPAFEENLIVRAANARGGFGEPAKEEVEPQGVENTVEAVKAHKIFQNGQLIIEKNGKRYDALGSQL